MLLVDHMVPVLEAEVVGIPLYWDHRLKVMEQTAVLL